MCSACALLAHSAAAQTPPRASTAAAAVAPADNRHWVFVYGTLRRNHRHHDLLPSSTFIGDFRTGTAYPRVVSTAYFGPVLLDIPGTGAPVCGEVYAVDDATLAALDKLENNDGVNYTRRAIKVTRVADPAATADAYVYLKCNGEGDMLTKQPIADRRSMKYVPRQCGALPAPTAVAARSAAAEDGGEAVTARVSSVLDLGASSARAATEQHARQPAPALADSVGVSMYAGQAVWGSGASYRTGSP